MLKVLAFVVLAASGDAQEAIYTVNGKRASHSVSEKFLSVSIDPAILLTGLNLSDTSLLLARHLSPAYIRIAGLSTQFVKYDESISEEKWEGGSSMLVTPAMWFGINEWLSAANLTPVFGINDCERIKGGWNPHSAMPLLQISDNFNLSCYWQLGYDCSNKTESEYKIDLRRLHHILEAFPEKKNIWKIVGSDLTKCTDHPETTWKVLDDLGDILTSVVKESQEVTTNSNHELMSSPIKPKVPIWLVTPKSHHPVTFSTAISWAKEVGEAARLGYEVVFRQPRLHEIFSETPPFWVSLFHKILMGRTVLEVKAGPVFDPQVSVYAHCSKNQNNFIRSGAMTVFTVNNSTQNHTILLRFGTVSLKNTEVQSYVLTGGASDVYLNGERLTLDSFSGHRMNFTPKLRRAKIVNYLTLSLPAKSVSFFVLPAARIPVCIHEEEDFGRLVEEINEDQKIAFSEEVSVEVTPRFFPHKAPTLRELQHQMQEELESDEMYKSKKERVKKVDARSYLLERAKLNEKQRKQLDESKRLLKVKEEPAPKRVFELELTSAEIRKVLADRAKTKAARKHIIFTSEELEEIMDKATEKFLKDKNTAIRIRKKSKREAGRDRKDINMKLLRLKTLGEKRSMLLRSLGERLKKTKMERRERRDINMDLLKLKTELLQNKNKKQVRRMFENNEKKEATIRESGQTSAEFEQDYVEVEEGSPLPDEDVFAEIADPDEFPFTTTEKAKFSLTLKPNRNKPLSLFNSHRSILPKTSTVKPVPLYRPKERIPIVEDYDEDSVSEEAFACIHEYIGGNPNFNQTKKKVSELWEVGGESVEEKKTNSLPSVTNRGFPAPEEDPEMSLEDDYEELESEDSDPIRLKRSNVPGEEILKEQQVRLLKKRLNRKKKLAMFEKGDKFNERYKSLSEGVKEWKPSDILTLRDSRARRRGERSSDNYVSSVENEIDNFMNEMAKEAKMVGSRLEAADGDYQLVFPNKDKIEVAEKRGETEVKLVLHGEGETTTGSSASNIQKIWKKQDDNLWQKLLRKVTKFFQRLSVKLKNYVLEDLLK